MPAALTRHARALQETFEVGTLPQAAALASLDEPEEIARRATENARVRGALEAWLAERGVDHWPSTTNFVAVRPADPAGVVERAAAHGVLVRQMTAFGDPSRVRIGVPAEADLSRALAALEPALS
jgi:histidinol-phosphate aminotransferase